MKFKNLIFLAVLGFNGAIAQFGPQQIISSTTERAYLSIPLDIDNDGFMDVLKSSLEDYKLQWHRNLNGEGNFGPEILITATPAFYLSIDFVDLDSDGDKDLLYLENNPRIVGWLENLDGLGNFGAEQFILNSQQDFIASINAEDIDNDGDQDLIAKRTNTFIDRIVWHENLDGLGNFGQENILIENVTEVHPPIIVDIDNDGNLDILTSHENTGPAKLIWYRNLGGVVFDTEQEIYLFPFFVSDWTSIHGIEYLDINTDEKQDIVIISHNDDFGTFYHWFENIDNQGNFGPIQALPIVGKFCDIDNDGDNDILVGNRFVNRIYWVENSDGLGTFTTERTITTEVDFLKDIKAADFNGDGRLDVVSASLGDDKIAWYENTGVLGVPDNFASRFMLYPNPTNGLVILVSSEAISEIQLFNTLGQKIVMTWSSSEIDLSNIESGIYFLRIQDGNGFTEIHKIIKK